MSSGSSTLLDDGAALGDGFGWELLGLTEGERDAMVEAAEAGDIERADAIVAGAYARLFGETH